MLLFELNAFAKAVKGYDDGKVKEFLDRYGISSVSEGNEDLMELMAPFLTFVREKVPADIDIPADVICQMAGRLDELAPVISGENSLTGDQALRNIGGIKGIRRRRVL